MLANVLLEGGRARGAAERAGVLLHGRGGDAGGMLELAKRLDQDKTRWLAPAADHGTWYPYRFMEPIALNEPFLSDAIARCDEAVQEASEDGRLDPSRIVILGFSQGACLTTEYVLRHPNRAQTVIVFTGGLMGPSGTEWRLPGSATLLGTRVLLTGSEGDEWVPEARVQETARVLTSLGADVHLRMYERRPHTVSEEELNEARAFIARSGA